MGLSITQLEASTLTTSRADAQIVYFEENTVPRMIGCQGRESIRQQIAGNSKPTECMLIMEGRPTIIGEPAMNQASIWLSLKNKKFRTLWLVTLILGGAVAAYNTAAVWLMNSLESSSFFIS